MTLRLSGNKVDDEPFTEGRWFSSGTLKIARRLTPATPRKR
jgi:hypothetical protein